MEWIALKSPRDWPPRYVPVLLRYADGDVKAAICGAGPGWLTLEGDPLRPGPDEPLPEWWCPMPRMTPRGSLAPLVAKAATQVRGRAFNALCAEIERRGAVQAGETNLVALMIVNAYCQMRGIAMPVKLSKRFGQSGNQRAWMGTEWAVQSSGRRAEIPPPSKRKVRDPPPMKRK